MPVSGREGSQKQQRWSNASSQWRTEKEQISWLVFMLLHYSSSTVLSLNICLSLSPSVCHVDNILYVCFLVCLLSANIYNICPCCIGAKTLVPGTKYWVPRIRLFFFAEDPRVFVERIQFAMNWRKNTEALLLYHLSVDCMPIWSGTSSLDSHSLQRIKQYALSTPRLRLKMLVMPVSCLCCNFFWYKLIYSKSQ